ncbi:hypothetical protein D9V37_02405 [Nocardioides mangrovicus]|uniref:Heavy metal transporter n=1 Tax=Nocardioides mangrovicus TaxID=2478913 RepID=A0A3L8P844_9ACTN|nr:hypothetical protein [Nocardioides mangrovicus]RLV50829.1 hypothetical protein D9V37_02405 [Nocardioides mangrovicus]
MRTEVARGVNHGLRWVLLGLVVVIVATVSVALYRGVGAVTGRQRCSATVGGHTVHLSPDQARNATLIAAIGVRRGLPARAVSIAFATAYQESKLQNLDHGDRDSLGLFQQRPSQGWGTAAQVRDPYYATNKFYDALAKVDGFETMRITEAAQRVQRSGFPEAYEPHAEDARALASALTGYSPGGRFSCVVDSPDGHGTAAATVTDLERAFGSLRTTGTVRDLVLDVGTGPAARRRGWSVAQYLVAHASTLQVATVSFNGRQWQAGPDSKKGWLAHSTPRGRVSVTLA